MVNDLSENKENIYKYISNKALEAFDIWRNNFE
jgi:hypothetical protein